MLAETICSAASAAGLGIAAVTAYRKRFLTATRIAAYALVPVGLVLTGVVKWVSDIAFKPSVWLGFGLLGVAWLLFMLTRAVERRGGGGRKERRAAPGPPGARPWSRALRPPRSARAPRRPARARAASRRSRASSRPRPDPVRTSATSRPS